MRIDRLEAGDRFALPFVGKTGTVVRTGTGAVVVRYDSDDADVEVLDKMTGEVKAAFHRKGRPVLISPGTEVKRA